MRIRTAALAAALLLGLTACGTADNPPATPSDKGGAEASTASPSTNDATRTVSPEDLAKAREAAGLPPEPTAEARRAEVRA
ncbi:MULTISPECIES: hypothetical protein [unclassified Streptomyces]|uniref:hypothetical protein n=1 Tax=unclassified Streptomyces TaxID=2593676 RepID=UPI0035E2D787